MYQVMVKTKQKVNEAILSADIPYTFIVKTTAMPVDGNANTAVINLIADYLKVPKSAISIKRGFKSKIKTIAVN
jgi:uncharacterized protein YggU (UPF0235/DUF167 family)